MRRAFFLLMAVGALSVAALAQDTKNVRAIGDLPLADLAGKSVKISDLRGTSGTVLIFVSAQCPVVRGYNDRMNELAAAYKAKGINVVGINSNVTESVGQIKAHAEATYKFPVYIDKGSVVADKLGASVTPEAYFIDAKDALIYHGAIDNDRSGDNVTERFLKAAFDASLAGKPVERTSSRAFGCTIKRSNAD